MTQFTIPGLTDKQAARLTELLPKQLSTYNDLHLTLKHIHWNVVGPNFIGAHEMIDPQVEAVRGFADDVAERIAALGASPQGTPGAIIKDRAWIGQAGHLEKFQWFVGAHLESAGGKLTHEGKTTEKSAVNTARRKS
jgi:starvation-inducible DNA-binding protein